MTGLGPSHSGGHGVAGSWVHQPRTKDQKSRTPGFVRVLDLRQGAATKTISTIGVCLRLA